MANVRQQEAPHLNRNGKPGTGGGPMASRMMAEKPKDMKKTLKRLLSYLGSSKKILFFLVFIVVIISAISLLSSVLQGNAIDAITITDEKLHVDKDKLYLNLGLLIGVLVISIILQYFQGVEAAKLSQKTVRIMRNDLFNKITHLSISYIDNHPHGDIMSRMTNDVDNISNTISQSIASIFQGIIMVIGSFTLMMIYSPLLTLISLVSIVLTIFVSKFLAKKMRKYFMRQQQLLGCVNSTVEEMVTGYRTVVAYTKENKIIKDFSSESDELKKTGIMANIFGGIMGPLMNFITNFGFLLIALFGGVFAIKGLITIGTIQIFINCSKQFSRPINQIANLYAQIETAIAGAERVFEIMDGKSETDEGTKNFNPKDFIGHIEFKNINFSYVPNEPVIRNFSLSVNRGEKIALVGHTGCGKTTIVNLLMRFYDIDSGDILIDGVSIFDIKKNDLRNLIAIVLQDTVLFTDTIRNNLTYGKENATFEEIVSAADEANAGNFIERLPNKYDTILEEAGANLSQGQRQLLAIARAILRDPKILILDEATSSVDTRTEKRIQDAMQVLMKNRTSLIIAHRLSTIRDADKIIVIDKGQVVEVGSHDELLASNGHYAELYNTQFAGEEI